MKKMMMLLLIFLAASCGNDTKTINLVGENGVNGTNGVDGISMGVDVQASAPSCSAGGSTIKTFVDSNMNSELDIGEIVKKITVICNGVNGDNGINGSSVSVDVAGTSICPNGGVVLNNVTPICNGENGNMGPQGPVGPVGPMGPQGAQGVQGIAGENGEDGLIGPVGPMGPQGIAGGVGGMTPIELCPGELVTYKEYGFVIGSDLFVVYYNHNAGYAFLAKLISGGSYVTTNGSGCTFTYQNNGSTVTVSNSSGSNSVGIGSNNISSALKFISTSNRVNGMNNNASIDVTFKNVSSVTLTKFEVEMVTNGSAYVRSGSSLVSPNGNVPSFTSDSLVFLVTSSGGIAPGASVTVRILLDSLSGSQVLNFTANAL